MSVLFGAPFGERLRQQLRLLNDLNGLYDQGGYDHALSIAGRVHVIVEMLQTAEGGQHLQSMKIKLCTPIDPADERRQVVPLVSRQALVDDNMNVVAQRNFPAFADPAAPPPFWIGFGKWLAQAAFFYAPGKFVSRERLIILMRNKDGGGHRYSLVPPEYLQFANDAGTISLKVNDGATPTPEPQIHYASMRQISHELLDSLKCLQ